MRFSLALGTFALGTVLAISGCSSSDDSSSPTNVEDNGTTGTGSVTLNVSGSTPFTTQMLAGKTFFVYGYGEEEGVPVTENRFVVGFSADASQINVHNHSDDTYGAFSVNGTSSIVGGEMVWHVDGTSGSTASVANEFADGSIMVMMVDADHFDPYPLLFSATERADKGQTLYDTFMAEQALTKETMTANGWYAVDWKEYDINDQTGELHCQALFMYNEDNTIDASFMDNGTLQSIEEAGTFVVSGNTLEADFIDGDIEKHYTMAPIAVLDGEIVWDNETAYFKNRADAVTFVELLGGGESCYQYFPAE